MKRFLLSICFLIITVYAHSQKLRIVKDNVNCSYGLKNQTGEWVLEPIYILIQEYNTGYFIVKDALGDGLFSPTGEEIIQCRFDRLEPVSQSWKVAGKYPSSTASIKSGSNFLVVGSLGDRKFVLNSQGKELVEFAASGKIELDGHEHFFIHSNQPFTTSYFHRSGKCLIDQFPGAIAPFGQHDFSLSGKRKEGYANVISGNVRVINRKGEYLLEKQFDYAIIGFEGKICFENDQKYGEMLVDGTVLIEPKYKRKLDLSTSRYQSKTWVIYSEDDKKGLMKSDRTVVLEPIYDQVDIPHRNRELQPWWRVQKDGLYAVYSENGRAILPLKYDQITFINHKGPRQEIPQTNFIVKKEDKYAYIIPLNSTVPKTWYDQIELVDNSSIHRGEADGTKLIVKRNDKFGILNMDGTELYPCMYDRLLKDPSRSNRLLMTKGLELTEFIFQSDRKEAITTKWEVVSRQKDRVIFTNSRQHVSGFLSDNGLEFDRISFGNMHQEVFGNMLVLDRSKGGEWDVVHLKTHEPIQLPALFDIQPFIRDKFQFRTQDNRIGLLDENGKVLIQPLYKEFKPNYRSAYIWACVERKRGSRYWVLLDDRGNQIFEDSTLQTFDVGVGDKLMGSDGKLGLFDTDSLRWKIQPIYPCLFKSEGEFYIAAFSKEKKGILRSDGTVFLPLEYSSIDLFTKFQRERNESSPKGTPEIRWIAKNGQDEIIINDSGLITASASEIRRLQESLLFKDDSSVEQFELIFAETQKQNNAFFERQIDHVFDLNEAHYSLSYFETGTYQNYPELIYSRVLPIDPEETLTEVREKRKNLWSNPSLKSIVFDSINAIWNHTRETCENRLSRFQIMPIQEEDIARQFKQDCSCAEQNHQFSKGGGFGGLYFQIDTITQQFASIAYGYRPIIDDRMLSMSQPPPPPPPAKHISFVYRNNQAIAIELHDIFPSDSVLLDEFIIALQKRDDLQLQCSSLDMMIQMIGGRFSLSEKGLKLHYSTNNYWHNDNIEFLIPIERLQLHSESKWIVPILRTP